MKFSLPTALILVAPALAQGPPPWASSLLPSDFSNGPWPTNAAAWSSIYSSLVTAGHIPSTLTQAPYPYPTDGNWGPGRGPWSGPGGSRSHGPGGWGGKS